MNQYHIRIDGEQSTDSYTYQELVDMGLFELDADGLNDIEVKKTTKPNFTPFKSYYFPERQSKESSYYVDKYGQIHRKNTSQRNDHNGAYVDEYGQIHRKNTSQRNDHNGAYVDEYGQIVRPNSPDSSSSSTSSSSSSSSPNYSSNNDGWETFWRVIGTIIIIAIVIAIIAGTGGIATPAALGAAYALRAIWKDS